MSEERGEYWVAEEIAPIALKLIWEYHRHLHEGEANILYLFTSKERKNKGRITLATAQVATPLQRYLTEKRPHGEADFILIFDAKMWEIMEPHQRTALVDHELCHCVQNDKGDGWALRGHDLEEFSEVVDRHGLYLPDVLRMAKAMETHQHALPLFDDADMGIVTMRGKAKGQGGTGSAIDRSMQNLTELVRADGITGMTISSGDISVTFGADGITEELYRKAARAVAKMSTVSTTALQDKLRCRWDVAARLIERLKAEGVIGTGVSEE